MVIIGFMAGVVLGLKTVALLGFVLGVVPSLDKGSILNFALDCMLAWAFSGALIGAMAGTSNLKKPLSRTDRAPDRQFDD